MTYDYFAAVVLPIGVKNYHESFTAILSPPPPPPIKNKHDYADL